MLHLRMMMHKRVISEEPNMLKKRNAFGFAPSATRMVFGAAIFLAFTAALGFGQGARTFPDEAPQGALVDEVTADGPAAEAGISAHDIITAIDGTAIRSVKQIIEALERHQPGDTMEMTVARATDGTTAEVNLTLGANPRDASVPYMGLSVISYMLLVPEAANTPSEQHAAPGI